MVFKILWKLRIRLLIIMVGIIGVNILVSIVNICCKGFWFFWVVDFVVFLDIFLILEMVIKVL